MPKTPQKGRRSATNAEPLHDDSISRKETPKSAKRSSPRKKLPSAEVTSSSKGVSQLANYSELDPFDFDSCEDQHPEPLKNISMHRTSFGDIKFSLSTLTSADRYSSIEKIAERKLEKSGINISPKAMTDTPVSVNDNSNLRLDLTTDSSDLDLEEFEINKKMNITKHSSGRGRKRRSTASKIEPLPSRPSAENDSHTVEESSFISPAKRTRIEFNPNLPSARDHKNEESYVVPSIGPDEQFSVDHPSEGNMLQAGARVMALWGNEYYSANICGRDGLGRYFVLFAEDNLQRVIPPSGVIPISSLTPSTKVCFIDEVYGDEIGKFADVLSLPGDEPETWQNGIFELLETETGATRSINWTKVYLQKDHGSAVKVKQCGIADIEKENITTESRSSRRSRQSISSLSYTGGGFASTPRRRTPKNPAIPKDEGRYVQENNEHLDEKQQPVVDSAEETLEIKTEKPSTETPKTAVFSDVSASSGALNNRTVSGIDVDNSIVSKVGKTEDGATPKKRRGRQKKQPTTPQIMKMDDNDTILASGFMLLSSQIAVNDQPKNGDIFKIEESSPSTPKKEDYEQQNQQETKRQESHPASSPGETSSKFVSVALECDEVVTDSTCLTDTQTSSTTNTTTDISSAQPSLPIPLLPSSIEHTDEVPTIEVSDAAPNKTVGTVIDRDADTGSPVVEVPSSTASSTLSSSPQKGLPIRKNDVSSSPDFSNASVSASVTPKKVKLSSPVVESLKKTRSAKTASPLISVAADGIDTKVQGSTVSAIFNGLKFILTSAARTKKNSEFNKRDYMQKIEDRGGQVVSDFSAINPDLDAGRVFLIADTHYRTQKYLCALSLSIPCVSQKWILECVQSGEMVDYQRFLLPAGVSSLDDDDIKDWKPLKGSLLAGKRVLVYANREPVIDEQVVSFVNTWTPIVRNLGATLVEPTLPATGPLTRKLSILEGYGKLDFVITESDCEREVADRAEAIGSLLVSSEWIIQAIITGELPDVAANSRFRYDWG